MEPSYDEEEIAAVTAYLRSGGWITEFKKTTELEEAIAEYVGSKHCIMLPNGTLSLWVALVALGIGKGDEVIVPDFTMVASANAIVLSGATPVFVDIAEDDLALDLSKTEATITPKTKAILLVSMNGRCARVHEFQKLANARNIHLIEDAAQSLGSFVGGTHLGTFGIIGSFSFSVPKIITMGQGGALVTDDDTLATKIRFFKDFGRPSGGSDDYQALGFNLKYTDLQAVFGIEQMKKLPSRVTRKKEMYARYHAVLSKIPQVTLIETSEETAPWFVDIFVSDPDKLAAFLKGRGIGTRRVYPALHTRSFLKAFGEFPVSTEMTRKGLWLPSALTLTDSDIDRVCKAITDFFQT